MNSNQVKFAGTLKQVGNNTGIEVPPEVVEALGAGKKPKVVVTLNGYKYRNSIASMGGAFMISVSADIRSKANVKGGDPIEVELTVDTEVREVSVPPDFAEALAGSEKAKAAFEKLSYSNQSRHVLSIEGAKTEETRLRRVAKAIEELSS